MLLCYSQGHFRPRRIESTSGIVKLTKLPRGRYPLSTTTGWYLLDIQGAKARLELGTASLAVTGKPGTRVRFYRTGSDLLVRVLSGRMRGSWNRIPKSGTLLLPYLRPGSYDICVGDMVYRKRIQVTGPGMRLQLD